VTERHELIDHLQFAEERYRSLVEQMPAVTYIQALNDDLSIEYVSPQVAAMFGYSHEACLSHPHHWIEMLHPDDRQRVVQAHEQARDHGMPLDVEYRQRTSNGAMIWVRDQARVINDEHGTPRYWHGVITNVSAQKSIEAQLTYQALHDQLTGLPNRRLLLDRIELALLRARRAEKRFAILFIDLNSFKSINDRFGHAAGDDLLRIVGQRLRGCIRGTDTAARLAGDEFAILIEDATDSDDVSRVVDGVRACLATPFRLPHGASPLVQVTASIGVAMSDESTRRGFDVLDAADAAMYEAKQGRSTTPAFAISVAQRRSH
jgi:diguanylate cyclase (GGDEF)-like protein/PAS domain S-box-containing protein